MTESASKLARNFTGDRDCSDIELTVDDEVLSGCLFRSFPPMSKRARRGR